MPNPMSTKEDILCFELIWQNQIRIMDNLLISRDHIIIDIQSALIPHDRVQHCLLLERVDTKATEQTHTPEERPGLGLRLLLQIQPDSTYGLNGRCTGGIPGQHDVKIGEMALAQALIQVVDFLGCRSCALELLITGVVA